MSIMYGLLSKNMETVSIFINYGDYIIAEVTILD